MDEAAEAGDRLPRRKAGSPGKILMFKQSVSVAMPGDECHLHGSGGA